MATTLVLNTYAAGPTFTAQPGDTLNVTNDALAQQLLANGAAETVAAALPADPNAAVVDGTYDPTAIAAIPMNNFT